MSQSLSQDTLATVHYMTERNATAQSYEPARKGLYQLGIKTSYDADRMIFSTLHTHKNQMSNIYAQECNGLILEMGTWKPLMVPPRSLRFNIVTDTSNSYLHQGLYHIYKVQDGTCFNLYYYNNKWIISTAKGYEMNNIKWDENTYQELISECLSKLSQVSSANASSSPSANASSSPSSQSQSLTWEDFTDLLDKQRCYSFGFKHPKFQRFFEKSDTPIYKLWFIQSVELNPDSPQYLWASDKSPFEQINSQEFYKKPVGNLKELYKIAMDALNTYLSTGDVCYGFILRSVNFETTGYHSDLFIESSLMRSIRQFWYENSIIDLCHSNKWNKETTITLNAYLDSKTYETFLLLFPQYQDKFALYSSTVDEIVDKMITLSNQATQGANQSTQSTQSTQGANQSTQSTQGTTQLAQSTQGTNLPDIKLKTAMALFERFCSTVRYDIINKFTEQKKRTFTEYVVHYSHLDLWMNLFA